MSLDYRRDDLFTAEGSYFHFSEPFRQLFPGLAALHASYNLSPVTISDCILTLGLRMTRERRGLWKTDSRNAIRSLPHLIEKTCFMDLLAITTRAAFASPQVVVVQFEVRNGEKREVRFQPRLMGGWFQRGRASFASNRLVIHHQAPAARARNTVVLVPSFRVVEARAGVPSVNVHCEWPQLEGSRYGPRNMYELLGPEVRLRAGARWRFEVSLGLVIGRAIGSRPHPVARFAATERRARAAAERHARRMEFTSSDRAVADRFADARHWMRANLVAARGRIRADVMVAHKKLSALWFWDTCFHALGWAALDPAKAEDHLLALARAQRRNGLIPQVISHHRVIVQPQPPIFMLMAFEVFRLTRNARFLREVLPAAERYHAWWDRHRFSHRFGLYFYKDAFDSGWDNSCRYDAGHGWLAPDLNAMMYRNLEAREFFCRRRGRAAEADALARKRERLGEAILRRLWNPKVRFFCDADARSGRLFDTLTPAGFLPLLVNGLSPARKAAMLKHLFNRSRFWLPHPIPTVAANDPRFVPWEYSYPRGTAWVSYGNWLPWLALRHAGLDAAAHALALRTIRTIGHCPDPGIYEHYNPLTGAGHGYTMLGWSLSTMVDLVRREYGADFTDQGQWIFTSPATREDYTLEMHLRGHRVRVHRKGAAANFIVDGRRVATLPRGTRCVMDRKYRLLTRVSLRAKGVPAA